MKRIETTWGNVAPWYDDLLEGTGGSDTYQQKVLLPNLTRLLAPFKGGRVADVACGQGFFSRELDKLGMEVIASDISRELITIARKKSPKTISYHVSPAHTLGFIADGSIDAVLIVLAIQNIDSIARVCKEVGRVLRPGGTFFIVMNHPAFRIPKFSSWGFDREKGIEYRRLDAYMSESRAVIEMHPGATHKSQTKSFHRPLQYYVKHLSSASFSITRLEEWMSHKTSGTGPRKSAEDRARKEFPLFLMLQAEKRK